jgi:hypothetical protein
MKAISPKVWGPSGWSLLHRLSFCFKNAKEAHDFYKTLMYILPCPKCRKNMADHFVKLPIPKKAKDFPEWLWKLHNRVNLSIDKHDKDPITFETVRNKYIYTCHDIQSCESTFLLAVAETHPGGRKIDSIYLDALKLFMNIFITHSFNDKNRPELNDNLFESRAKLRKYIQKITNSHEEFEECTA